MLSVIFQVYQNCYDDCSGFRILRAVILGHENGKTCLRNRTGDQRLTDLVKMYTCKDRAKLSESEKIIESFANASTSTRRVHTISVHSQDAEVKCIFNKINDDDAEFY